MVKKAQQHKGLQRARGREQDAPRCDDAIRATGAACGGYPTSKAGKALNTFR